MALDLTEILKDAPKGTPLYSTVLGEVFLKGISKNGDCYPILVTTQMDSEDYFGFTKEGLWSCGFPGECVLFPSKDNRDWSTFKVNKPYKMGDYLLKKATNKVYKIVAARSSDTYDIEPLTTSIGIYYKLVDLPAKVLRMDFKVCERFPLDTLIPFTRILVRNEDCSWLCALFSHIESRDGRTVITADSFHWDECVPYNDETKHLVGTTDDEPEFYRQVNKER